MDFTNKDIRGILYPESSKDDTKVRNKNHTAFLPNFEVINSYPKFLIQRGIKYKKE